MCVPDLHARTWCAWLFHKACADIDVCLAITSQTRIAGLCSHKYDTYCTNGEKYIMAHLFIYLFTIRVSFVLLWQNADKSLRFLSIFFIWKGYHRQDHSMFSLGYRVKIVILKPNTLTEIRTEDSSWVCETNGFVLLSFSQLQEPLSTGLEVRTRFWSFYLSETPSWFQEINMRRLVQIRLSVHEL